MVSIEQIIIATITLLARLSKLVYRRTPEEAFRSRSYGEILCMDPNKLVLLLNERAALRGLLAKALEGASANRS